MPKKKRKLSLEEHQKIGFELKQINRKINDLYFQLQEVYGKSSPVCKGLDLAINRVESVKCEMDNYVCEEFPFEGNDVCINAYYGTAREEFITANNPETQFLISQVITRARLQYDGHLSIFRFTTGWKAAYGTPDLDYGDGRSEVSRLPKFSTLEECLSSLLQKPIDFATLSSSDRA